MPEPSPDPTTLLAAGGTGWRGGGPLVLTFSFATDALDPLGNALAAGQWAGFSAAQQASARLALAAWAAACGISFLEVPDTAGGAGIDLRFRLETLGTGVAGTGWGPDDPSLAGDIALSLALFRNDSLAPSTSRIGFATLLHEIGHAIGLEHPAPALGLDATVMATTVIAGSLGQPQAPRALDAAAAQWLYGSDAAEQALGQSWTWDAALGAVRGSGGGTLVGTGLRDLLSGGAEDDTLLGGAGEDTVLVGAGADRLEGGAGVDLLRFDLARGAVVLDLARGTAGALHFSGVERFEFTDGMLVTDAGAAAAQVLRLYQAAFGRAPDASGLAVAVGRLGIGVTTTELSAGVLDGAGFAGAHLGLDDAGFAALVAANLGAPALALEIAGDLALGHSRAAALAAAAETLAAQQATAAALAEGVWVSFRPAAQVLALGIASDWTLPGGSAATAAASLLAEAGGEVAALPRAVRAALHHAEWAATHLAAGTALTGLSTATLLVGVLQEAAGGNPWEAAGILIG